MLVDNSPHWAAIFPVVVGKEFDELVDDIGRRKRLIHPIVRIKTPIGPRKWVWQILDGVTRLRACEAAGVEPTFVEYGGDDPLGYVFSANRHRRHLNESQRAIVAARALALRGRGRPKKNGSYAELSAREAGHLLNIDPKTIGDAKRVIAKGTPEVVAAVEGGELAVTAAAELVQLPKGKQRELLDKSDKTDVRAAARAERNAPVITQAIRLSETDRVALQALAELGSESRNPRARAGVVVLRRMVPTLEGRR